MASGRTKGRVGLPIACPLPRVPHGGYPGHGLGKPLAVGVERSRMSPSSRARCVHACDMATRFICLGRYVRYVIFQLVQLT